MTMSESVLTFNMNHPVSCSKWSVVEKHYAWSEAQDNYLEIRGRVDDVIRLKARKEMIRLYKVYQLACSGAIKEVQANDGQCQQFPNVQTPHWANINYLIQTCACKWNMK